MNITETVVTEKGTTTIPQEIRRSCGIEPGAVLTWSVRNGVIHAQKKDGALNTLQKHLRDRAGTWDGKISGEELLKRTRP